MSGFSSKRWKTGVAVLVLALAAAVSAVAQSSAGLSGQIIGPDGKGMAKTLVTITRLDVPATYTVKTDKKGNYGYYTLPVGTYKVDVTGPDGKQYNVIKSIRTSYSSMKVANFSFKRLAEAEAANMPPPPPGMTPAQAAAYKKKLAANQAAAKKITQLNVLLKQNKTFFQAKQYDQAIAVMQQAVALDQTHDVLYANLAQDYAMDKQYANAAAAYQKALALSPNNASYMINLGTTLYQQGKTDEANAEFAKAAAVDPSAANTAMYNTAVLLFNAGKSAEAAAAFDKVIAIDPNNANAWYYKGLCLLGQAQVDPKTGKTTAPAGTRAALQKSIQLAPTGPNAANAKAALSALAAPPAAVGPKP